MKKTIFYTSLVLFALLASIYFVQIPKVAESPTPIAKVEVISPTISEKASIWASDNSRGYYGDALEQAFEKAQLDEPTLAAKVKEWNELYSELMEQNSQYAKVVHFYSEYTQAATAKIQQLNDSTQASVLNALLLSIEQKAEWQLAIDRIQAIAGERARLNDYMIALKIKHTQPYFVDAVSFSEDEAQRFEAMQADIQGFIAE